MHIHMLIIYTSLSIFILIHYYAYKFLYIYNHFKSNGHIKFLSIQYSFVKRFLTMVTLAM